jgi:cold shock CspA family protein
MAETTAKKEKEKKKAKNKQDKAEKMRERKAHAKQGKSLEDMMAYVDENGNLSATPPDPKKAIVTSAEDIHLGPSRPSEPEEINRKGIITYFNDAKGYGFITDNKSKANIFVHINQLSEKVKEGNLVTYEIERGARGLSAIRVKVSR